MTYTDITYVRKHIRHIIWAYSMKRFKNKKGRQVVSALTYIEPPKLLNKTQTTDINIVIVTGYNSGSTVLKSLYHIDINIRGEPPHSQAIINVRLDGCQSTETICFNRLRKPILGAIFFTQIRYLV